MNRVLNSLPVFVSAVEMKSMTKAAAAHNMSQSMATRHIQLIERELNGVQLLQRSRTGVTLTPKGLVFYTAIKQALQQVNGTADLLRTEDDRTVLRVRTTLPSLAQNWIIPRLAEFRQLHPSYLIDFSSIEEENFHSQLNLPDLVFDILLTRDRAYQVDDPRFERHQLVPEILVCVGGRGHTESYPIKPADQAKYYDIPMISTQRRQDAIDIWCASVGLDIKKLRIVGRYPDFAMAIRAAVAGNGLLVVPFHIAEQDISAGHLVDYGGLRIPTGDVYCCYVARSHAKTRRVRDFLKWLIRIGSEASPKSRS